MRKEKSHFTELFVLKKIKAEILDLFWLILKQICVKIFNRIIIAIVLCVIQVEQSLKHLP